MAARENLGFTLGETWAVAFILRDADEAPLNLTGATVEFLLDGLAASIIATLTTPAAGEGQVVILPADQAGLTAGVYPYEIRATLAGGVVTTQIVGDLTADPSLF